MSEIVLLNADADAQAIGELYQRAKSSIVESVKYQIECGQRLADKKATLPHGQWLPWLEEQADVLGFETPRTAQRLLKLSGGNTTSTSYLEPPEAAALSRQTWGNAPHVSNNSGENEWYTPVEFIEAARRSMGSIDLDPASCDVANRTVQATRYYDMDTNGLESPWSGNVWMNPPYAQPLVSLFAERVASMYESDQIDQACILVNNATETEWFRRMLLVSSACCFLQGRVKFVDVDGVASGAPLQGQAVLYMGDVPEAFGAEFMPLGAVLRP